MKNNMFKFSAFIYQEQKAYVAICKEVDIVTEGLSEKEAMNNLEEAVSLYIECAIENNLPILRPIPPDQDYSLIHPERLIKSYPLFIDCKVKAYA